MPRAKAPAPTAAAPTATLASPSEEQTGVTPAIPAEAPADQDKIAQPSSTQAPAAMPSSGPSSKLDRLVALLRRPEGATLAQMTEATGWQVHSVRGALAGSLRKKGHAVTSEKVEGTRHYRIALGGGIAEAEASGTSGRSGETEMSSGNEESGQ